MATAFDGPAPPPAGFWIRFAAALIDSLVFLVVEFALGFAAGLVWGVDIKDSGVFKAAVTVFMFVFGSVYYVALHAALGQTIGKTVVKVKVVRLDGGGLSVGTSILRYLGYFASGVIFLIGYVMAGLRRDKRALHDLIAETRVIRLRDAAS